MMGKTLAQGLRKLEIVQNLLRQILDESKKTVNPEIDR
jgi:hypothetical protein